MRFKHIIGVIDSHTSGEPTRIIVDGFPQVKGSTMAERMEYLNEQMDWLRKSLMREPRGHRDMFGAILTSPCNPEADYGLMYMDSGGFLTMCGHGTIGAVMTLVEMGMVEAKEPETVVVFDTPAGLVKAHAVVEHGKVRRAWIENVPAFLYKMDIPVEVEGLGKISVDISFGGNFFALVTADQVGIPLELHRVKELVDIGLRIRAAVNQQVSVEHPIEKHINKVELTEITGPAVHPEAHARNILVFGEGSVDRSPCGTGTCARMAEMYAKGQLKLGQPFVHESIIGSLFHGELVREEKVGHLIGVVPRVGGAAYITGIQQFVIDPDDPMKYGFLV